MTEQNYTGSDATSPRPIVRSAWDAIRETITERRMHTAAATVSAATVATLVIAKDIPHAKFPAVMTGVFLVLRTICNMRIKKILKNIPDTAIRPAAPGIKAPKVENAHG